jgi:hypothetical protein
MGRIIKALILGWISKKIYDRVAAREESKVVPLPKRPHRGPAAARKTTRRSARAA